MFVRHVKHKNMFRFLQLSFKKPEHIQIWEAPIRTLLFPFKNDSDRSIDYLNSCSLIQKLTTTWLPINCWSFGAKSWKKRPENWTDVVKNLCFFRLSLKYTRSNNRFSSKWRTRSRLKPSCTFVLRNSEVKHDALQRNPAFTRVFMQFQVVWSDPGDASAPRWNTRGS